MMKAVVVRQPGQLQLEDVPRPQPNPYQALVQILACGVCNSTDWKIIDGQMPWAGPLPLLLGHESVGRVQQVGSKVRRFAVGDLVSRPIVPAADGMGSAFGGFAQYGIVTDAQAKADAGDDTMLSDYNARRQLVLPPDLPLSQAVLAISLSETASVLDGLGTLAQRRVLIAGTGIAGLALSMWCKLAGARRVVTLGRRAQRLERARLVGADAAIDTTADDWLADAKTQLEGGADVAIEAVGDVRLAQDLHPLLTPDAVAQTYGVPPGTQNYPPPWTPAAVNEQDRMAWVIDLLQRQIIDPAWFLTHHWPMDQIAEAFEAVRRGQVVKGVSYTTRSSLVAAT
jgi:threonine dehydrogenase-like Zn-dependent dehydrogenase